MAKMRITGLDQIERLLRTLPRSNQRKIQRRALRAGSRVLVKEMRDFIDRIPDDRLGRSGKERFKKSVGVVTSKTRLFEGKVFVGPRYSGVKNIAPDAHLFEFGTDDRYTADGRFRGRIEPTPFVRPAWDSKKKEAVGNIVVELLDKTIEEAKKLRRS